MNNRIPINAINYKVFYHLKNRYLKANLSLLRIELLRLNFKFLLDKFYENITAVKNSLLCTINVRNFKD